MAECLPQSVINAAGTELVRYMVGDEEMECVPKGMTLDAHDGWVRAIEGAAQDAMDSVLAVALSEYERLGYRLVRDDEATAEQMLREALAIYADEEAKALRAMDQHSEHGKVQVRVGLMRRKLELLESALTAAQGGEG